MENKKGKNNTRRWTKAATVVKPDHTTTTDPRLQGMAVRWELWVWNSVSTRAGWLQSQGVKSCSENTLLILLPTNKYRKDTQRFTWRSTSSTARSRRNTTWCSSASTGSSPYLFGGPGTLLRVLHHTAAPASSGVHHCCKVRLPITMSSFLFTESPVHSITHGGRDPSGFSGPTTLL